MILQVIAGSVNMSSDLIQIMKSQEQKEMQFLANYLNDNEGYLRYLLIITATKEMTKSIFPSFLL